MSKTPWSAPTTADEAHRRAAGRRHYNSIRTLEKDLRRAKVAQLISAYGMGYGVQARMARELGVSEATISRDVKYLVWSWSPAVCSLCDTAVRLARWEELERQGRVVIERD